MNTLSDDQHRTVQTILARSLPSDATTWIFGPRATGKVRRASDLDLAIDAGRPLSREEMVSLADAFEASDLPFNVDVVDYTIVAPEFRSVIDRTKIPWRGGAR